MATLTTRFRFSAVATIEVFLFATASIPALGPTQPGGWVRKAPNPVVDRLEREADHSPPSISNVKNAWSYTSTPPILFHIVVLE